MVDESEGQFYTMEGIAAAVLMVLTAYLVMSTTSMYTPGDSHIIDMQLEQIGNDALKMLDTKTMSHDSFSPLESIVRNWSPEDFKTKMDETLKDPSINFKATVYHRYVANSTIEGIPFYENSTRPYITGENSVTVSRWVYLKAHTAAENKGHKQLDSTYWSPGHTITRDETVLIEVLLWRN